MAFQSPTAGTCPVDHVVRPVAELVPRVNKLISKILWKPYRVFVRGQTFFYAPSASHLVVDWPGQLLRRGRIGRDARRRLRLRDGGGHASRHDAVLHHRAGGIDDRDEIN